MSVARYAVIAVSAAWVVATAALAVAARGDGRCALTVTPGGSIASLGWAGDKVWLAVQPDEVAADRGAAYVVAAEGIAIWPPLGYARWRPVFGNDAHPGRPGWRNAVWVGVPMYGDRFLALGVIAWPLPLLGLPPLVIAAWPVVRTRRRRRGGRCVSCGYDLRGSAGGRCPECGVVRPVTPPPAAEPLGSPH